MSASLSPFTRRLAALALLALAALIALSTLESVLSRTGAAIASLDEARTRTARLEAMRDRPSPGEPAPLPGGVYLQAPSYEAAAALAQERVEAAAAGAELIPQGLAIAPVDPANPNLVAIAFALEGPEAKILQFVGDVEGGLPAIRLREWGIERLDGAAPVLRLRATALAAWEGGR